MTPITPAELARELGRSQRTIEWHAARCGIKPVYGYTAEDAERIRESVRTAKPGRPRKGGT